MLGVVVVVVVSHTEDGSADCCCNEGPSENADFHTVIGFATNAEGEFTDEQGHGEADASNETHSDHIDPFDRWIVGSMLSPGRRVTRNVLVVIPRALPRTRPATIPRAIVSWNKFIRPLIPPTVTPAAKTANIGTAMLAGIIFPHCPIRPSPVHDWLR